MLRSTFLLIGLIFTMTVQGQKLDHVQGELIVQFHPKVENIQSVLTRYATYRGRNTLVKSKRCLSSTMNIWQLKFDFATINERQLLQTLRSDRLVDNVQFNHFISPRNTPNDPDFLQQWQYLNSQNPMADLDAEQAWDITTGGVTVNGDTIVVAAIDDGVDFNHEDFGDNLWKNYQEIPNNGIDDDNNGYIDDVNGWNARTDNGDVSGGGSHGTPVMGIMGAQGNNGIGVTGVNWDVKLMLIQNNGFDATEATLLAGYNYPLAMRKMYNESNGEAGAFVVATNTSWGIDNGMAADAPIWCALFDSLGTVGILNCGATANANTNVDIEGDLPTTCPSDYLIGVTNVNRNGNKDFLAGFGKTHIDLGAFGEDAYTLARNNQYRIFGGTSGATPHVTGAIGLLYSASCNNLGDLTKSNPAAAALLVRQYILEGAQPNESLDTITSTGGQLNLNNSLQLLVQNCGPCPPPVSVMTSNIIDISARIDWISSTDETATTIRYKPINETDWITLASVTAPYDLMNLVACTDYEYQIKSDCGAETSGFGKSFFFKTDGCCISPQNIQITEVTNDKISLSWDALFAGKMYEINFRAVETGATQTFSTPNASIDLTDLIACTMYEFQIRTICENFTTDFSTLQTVTTAGCGSCTDAQYCQAAGRFDDEWIEKVTLNTLVNESGSDNGYGDYTGLSTDLTVLETYDLTVNIGYDGFPFAENIQVWIDYNQDGVFDEETENIVNLEEDITNELIMPITIPDEAKAGLTRMRIAIKWREGTDTSKPEACGTYDFGEVEDYCVNIIRLEGACFTPKGLKLLDVPLNDVAVLGWEAAAGALSYNYRYRVQGTTDWEAGTTEDNNALFISGLEKCNIYEFQAQSLCDSMKMSDFSESFIFNTFCTCAPPTNVQQTDTLPNRVNLVWEATDMAGKYEVNLNKVGESSIIRLVVDENNTTITSLDKCNEYEVKIRSFCLDTNGVFSEPFMVVTACDVAVTNVPLDVTQLTVYPNPVVDRLQVAIELKTATNLTLKLYDAAGKVMLNQQENRLTAGLTTIALAVDDLASGVYLLGVETDKGRTVRRVVKF
ncbi:MAG: S8 family serine peptidase [Saprospiraceae bacterium]